MTKVRLWCFFPSVADCFHIKRNLDIMSKSGVFSKNLRKLPKIKKEPVAYVMHVSERLHNETLVLMISGRVTFYSRKVFQALVKTARYSGAKHIIFNMQEVTFMDSAALGSLVLAYLNLNEGDMDMSVIEPKSPVKTLLEGANFPSMIPTYPTEESAFQATQ
jgi:anti-anti-sigma factor